MQRESAADPRRAETGQRRRIVAVKARAPPEHSVLREIMTQPMEPPLRIVAGRKLPVRTTLLQEQRSLIAAVHRPRAQTTQRREQPQPIVVGRKPPTLQMPPPELLPLTVADHKHQVPKVRQRVPR